MLPCATRFATCGSIFDPARIRRELADIEKKLSDPALWNDPAASKPIMRDRKRLENLVADDEELVRRTGDIDAYFELAREGEDVLADLERDIKALATFTEELEARTMLSGEADPLNAIVTVHPGAGGTESQDWAEMLMRMYLRWAEQQGFKTEINDYQDGEEAGIKSATFTIIGEYAFGQLAGESGVTGWCAFLRSTRRSDGTLRLLRFTFRPRSTIRFRWISRSKTCASIHIVPAARAASM